MKRSGNPTKDLIIRYSVLVLFSIIGAKLFQIIFAPLTIYPSNFLFSLFYNVTLNGNVILLSDFNLSLEVIGACIAGSAYLLFLILNLSTPKIKIKKRLTLIGLSFLSFLILNVMRIFIVGVLFIKRVYWAEFAHEISWYAGSVILVIIIWFAQVKYAKIKETPFYSDVRNLIKNIKK